MLSRAEQAFYFWLARDWARDAGAIVDLGCFAGGSTARLAEGRRQAGHCRPVLACDRFTAPPEVRAQVLYAADIAPFEGTDLLALVRRLLARRPVTLVPDEIRSAVRPGGPIEILTIDAVKAIDTADAIAGTFFPALLPGGAVVVQQDRFHWRQPWIAVQMEALAGCFAPLTAGPGTTAAFLCLRPPTPNDLARAACHGTRDAELACGLTAARARFARFRCENASTGPTRHWQPIRASASPGACGAPTRPGNCRSDTKRAAPKGGPGSRSGETDHLMILETTPAPTVRPPSRMAKRSFSSIAIGAISSTVNFRLSPGITISVPSGS
ncbi:hypothetical protein EV657_108124 [Rhodovulum visakhapatnamense]|uniref:Methyltransferase family protein n=1 Tax=Rhodovulum visakhapatnamense TaxID=364297 RepID=A0A4R8G142_9RHOB|nr:hypothetical protein EV657_108124 [Rhodovulum visakhapatnamense]